MSVFDDDVADLEEQLLRWTSLSFDATEELGRLLSALMDEAGDVGSERGDDSPRSGRGDDDAAVEGDTAELSTIHGACSICFLSVRALIMTCTMAMPSSAGIDEPSISLSGQSPSSEEPILTRYFRP